MSTWMIIGLIIFYIFSIVYSILLYVEWQKVLQWLYEELQNTVNNFSSESEKELKDKDKNK